MGGGGMMAPMAVGEILTRRARPDDRAAVLELCRRALGWRSEDPDEAFFVWKHEENPFGESPAWVATSPEGAVVGLRVFLRWDFCRPDGRLMPMVRAVDTATDPDWEGRGIFKRLTTGALPELEADGIEAVFNTPNERSRPGYLKMGWSIVGTVPVVARIRSLAAAPRIMTARTAADLWSEPVSTGIAAPEAFADDDEVEQLLRHAAPATGVATHRTAEFLRWRYRFEPLQYRVLPIGSSLRDGVVLFRVRRRGAAREATICDVIAPRGAKLAAAMGKIVRDSGSDYLLASSTTAGLRSGFLPAPRIGPILTWRSIGPGAVPDMASLGLTLGDIELF